MWVSFPCAIFYCFPFRNLVFFFALNYKNPILFFSPPSSVRWAYHFSAMISLVSCYGWWNLLEFSLDLRSNLEIGRYLSKRSCACGMCLSIASPSIASPSIQSWSVKLSDLNVAAQLWILSSQFLQACKDKYAISCHHLIHLLAICR